MNGVKKFPSSSSFFSLFFKTFHTLSFFCSWEGGEEIQDERSVFSLNGDFSPADIFGASSSLAADDGDQRDKDDDSTRQGLQDQDRELFLYCGFGRFVSSLRPRFSVALDLGRPRQGKSA